MRDIFDEVNDIFDRAMNPSMTQSFVRRPHQVNTIVLISRCGLCGGMFNFSGHSCCCNPNPDEVILYFTNLNGRFFAAIVDWNKHIVFRGEELSEKEVRERIKKVNSKFNKKDKGGAV